MTALANKRLDDRIRTNLKSFKNALATAADDIARGFFDITHSSFALLGLLVVFAVVTLTARPDLRDAGELKLMAWLQERRVEVAGSEPEPVRAADPAKSEPPVAPAQQKSLSSQQVAVASWISKKYSVAQEPVGTLVAEAFEVGHSAKLDPTLILAIMAIESGFNPFAQSPVGAQGLMQVITRVHHDKYAKLGGRLAAFDPVANLRVGVKVLQDCITRAGSVEGGLKYYVGAANLENDGGYADKVMAERARLQDVVGGKRPPTARVLAAPAPRLLPTAAPATVSARESTPKAAQDVAQLGE
ncbi:MAG: lytic transglycosylase domain-containing protein [Polaromonas sp.]|nr:lytic transglycosylase domain-containing protein [Polaromonas sp.]